MERPSFHLILHSAALIEDDLRKRLGVIGLHPRQARVLDALSRMAPASQVELVREFRVSAASMSTMTARLIEGGYIARERHPTESRTNLLRLTDKGLKLLGDINETWFETDRMIQDKLGADKALELFALVSDLYSALGARAPGTGRGSPEDS